MILNSTKAVVKLRSQSQANVQHQTVPPTSNRDLDLDNLDLKPCCASCTALLITRNYEALTGMEQQGVVQKSVSKCASPLGMVWKKNGSLRIEHNFPAAARS